MKRIALLLVTVTVVALLPAESASAYKVKRCEGFPVRAYWSLDYRATKVRAYRTTCRRAKRIIKQTWAEDNPDTGSFICNLRFGSRSSVFCGNGWYNRPNLYRWARATILVR